MGVVEGSSEMGLTEEEYETMTDAQKEDVCRKVKESFKSAGAHYVIQNLSGLEELLIKLTQ